MSTIELRAMKFFYKALVSFFKRMVELEEMKNEARLRIIIRQSTRYIDKDNLDKEPKGYN